MMEEQFGTEAIEKAFDVLIELGQGIESRLADDNKISIAEAVSLAVGTFPAAYAVGKDAKRLKDEYLDWSDEEQRAVLLKVATKFDLENDRVEAMIEKGLTLLLAIDDFVDSTKKPE